MRGVRQTCVAAFSVATLEIADRAALSQRGGVLGAPGGRAVGGVCSVKGRLSPGMLWRPRERDGRPGRSHPDSGRSFAFEKYRSSAGSRCAGERTERPDGQWDDAG